MDNAASITALLSLFRERDDFLVTSHARPDGDAIGSALGMMHLLEALGKRVTVAFADPIPSIYSCLPGVERIVREVPPGIGTAILLECDSIERTGYATIAAEHTINIDHHISGRNYADVNWIDPIACAVGCMVYDLAIASGTGVSPGMASCIYAAIMTDTGSFTFTSTTAETFRTVAHLLESGADGRGVTRALYFSNPPAKLHILGTALSNLQIAGPVAWSTISLYEMQEAGATVEDCEGIVNHLIAMADIQVAAFVRELPAREQFRLSLRSKGTTDIAKVAEAFGGGGHRIASGCTLHGCLTTVSDNIVAALTAACEGQGVPPVLVPTLIA